MNEISRFEDILERFGQLVYTNTGTSMMPLLREGRDLMVIDRKSGKACKKYDAVLFKRPGAEGGGTYVLHRILRVNPDGSYWIAGDNCCTGETVREEQILGVLSAVIRGGRRVTVTDPAYRFYVALWCRFYPLRFALLRARHLAGRCLRRLGLRA